MRASTIRTFSTVFALKPSLVQSGPDDPGIETPVEELDDVPQLRPAEAGPVPPPSKKKTLREALKATRSFAAHPVAVIPGRANRGGQDTPCRSDRKRDSRGRKRGHFPFRTRSTRSHAQELFASSHVTYDGLFDRIKNAELLILDDLGSQASTAWAEEKLYQLIVHRHNASLPTVITSRVLLEASNGGAQDSGGFGTRYSEAISSRLRDGLVVTERLISAPDYRSGAGAGRPPAGRDLRDEPADADRRRTRFRLYILPNSCRTGACQVGVCAGPRYTGPSECRMVARSGRRGRCVFYQQIAVGTRHATRCAAWPFDAAGDVARVGY